MIKHATCMTLIVLFLSSMNLAFGASGDTATAIKSVDTIQVSDPKGSTGATYYVKPVGGSWAATGTGGCSGAISDVYFWAAEEGSSEMYALFLTAKTTNRKVQVWGECIGGTLIYAEYVRLSDS